MAIKPLQYKILITFESPGPIPMSALNEVAGSAMAQLEGLSDDHAIEYGNAQLVACRLNPHSKLKMNLSRAQVETITQGLEVLEQYHRGEAARARRVRRSVRSVVAALTRGRV